MTCDRTLDLVASSLPTLWPDELETLMKVSLLGSAMRTVTSRACSLRSLPRLFDYNPLLVHKGSFLYIRSHNPPSPLYQLSSGEKRTFRIIVFDPEPERLF